MATSRVYTSIAPSVADGIQQSGRTGFCSDNHRVAVISLALWGVTLYIGAKNAEATPIMDVNVNRTEYDFWPENDGLETLWEITVTNTSDSGQHNNMIDFTYPSGSWIDPIPNSTEGIFYIDLLTSPHWTPVQDRDKTVFQGLLTPGSNVKFSLYSTQLGTAKAYATATAEGIALPIPFNEVLVDVPAPEPASLCLLAAGFLPLLRRKSQALG